MLSERAPDWVNINVWIDECLASDDPYVNRRDAAVFLWVEPEEILDILTRKQARYITSGRNHLHVSRKWLNEQLTDRLSVGSVANLFSVSEAEVWEWLNKNLLVCPLEVHRHVGTTSFLWKPCWGAILAANSRPQTPEVIDFFVRRRHESRSIQLWGTKHSAAELGWEPSDIEKMAEAEELPSLLTPAGTRRFNPYDIRALAGE